MSRRILLIEDDADISLSLKYNLEREGGFTVAVARDGEAGLREALARPPELVLLDLNLPGMGGLDVCRRLRREGATRGIPIIMITARVDESDRVAGLELGADDYVTKPFSVREVVARVRAVLRRVERDAEGAEATAVACGPLLLDAASRRVRVSGQEVSLTRREFDLLEALMRGRGRVLTREKLLERVWGYTYPGETRTVDVHVRKLRRKLGDSAGAWIETVVGVGYRFREEA
jgi:two-component system alkaline phosphatase synthesis response regulator PhoP